MGFRPEDYCLLVVDDEEDLADIVAEELEDYGFKVKTAYSGREALEVVKSQPIDYVVSDVKMPNGDGKELLSSIRSRDPAVPVVLLMTGFSEISEEEVVNAGATALLNKPIDIEALFERIKKHFS